MDSEVSAPAKDKPFCIPTAFEEATNFFNWPLLIMWAFGGGLILLAEALITSGAGGMVGSVVAGVMVGLIFYVFAAMIRMMIARQQGVPLNPVMALLSASGRAFTLTIVFLITALLAELGHVALLVPGIVLGAIFFLTDQLAVRENLNPWAALKKAFSDSRGYRLAFFLICALFVGIDIFIMLTGRLLHLWYSFEASLGFTLLALWGVIAYKAAVAVAAYAQLKAK